MENYNLKSLLIHFSCFAQYCLLPLYYNVAVLPLIRHAYCNRIIHNKDLKDEPEDILNILISCTKYLFLSSDQMNVLVHEAIKTFNTNVILKKTSFKKLLWDNLPSHIPIVSSLDPKIENKIFYKKSHPFIVQAHKTFF